MKILNVIICFALVSMHVAAQGGQHSPRVNAQGKIQHSISLGEISFGRKSIVPLIMHFKSDSKALASSLVPQYEIPFLEARAMKIDENVSRVILPNGTQVELRKNTKGIYNASHPWTVKVDGKRISLSKEDEEINYYQGRIKSWRRPDGEILKWVDGSAGLESIIKGNGTKILGIERTSEKLKLEHSNEKAEVVWSFLESSDKEALKRKFIPVLESYSSLRGSQYIIKNTLAGELLKHTLMDDKRAEISSFVYDHSNGNALMLDGLSVEIKKVNGFQNPQISLLLEKGKILHKATHRSLGVEKELQADGAILTKNYFITPRGRRLRKTTILKDGIEKELYKAYYNTLGILIKDQRGEFTRELIDGIFHVYKNNKIIRKYEKEKNVMDY